MACRAYSPGLALLLVLVSTHIGRCVQPHAMGQALSRSLPKRHLQTDVGDSYSTDGQASSPGAAQVDGTKTQQVTDVAGLRATLADATVSRIELPSSLWLSEAEWPATQNKPLVVTRNVTLTSTESAQWASLQLNFLSNRVQLAPRVTLTFSRLFVHGIRQDSLSTYPGDPCILLPCSCVLWCCGGADASS